MKDIDRIDDICRRFIAACPFIVVATRGEDGKLSLSPKGDPAGLSRRWTKRRSRFLTGSGTGAWTPILKLDFSSSFRVTVTRRAHEHPVEDYASVMLRSASDILGTVEVGNGFPRDGTDGEWKIAGRDAILTMKDGIMKLATANGDEILPSATVPSPYFTAVRDALDR